MIVSAETYFLDVGQGTANVILLGDGRAIIIDCGPRSSSHVLLQLLNRYVSIIEALVLSHNDDDHVGAAPTIISRYPKAIRRIYRVQDRDVKTDKIAKLLSQELRAGNLLQPPFDLCCEESARELFFDPLTGIQLVSVAPTHWETQEAQLVGNTNLASAIVVLKCAERRIVFAGDSHVSQWRTVSRNHGGPLNCDVLAVSHHGGKCWSNNANESAELAWLYSDGVRCKHAVISVGTSNNFNNKRHPNQNVAAAIRTSGAAILCTQITSQCCSDLESLRPGVRLPVSMSRSSSKPDKTSSGRSANVACAGTVIAEVSPNEVRIRQLADHQLGVDNLCKMGANVLCRTSSTPISS